MTKWGSLVSFTKKLESIWMCYPCSFICLWENFFIREDIKYSMKHCKVLLMYLSFWDKFFLDLYRYIVRFCQHPKLNLKNSFTQLDVWGDHYLPNLVFRHMLIEFRAIFPKGINIGDAAVWWQHSKILLKMKINFNLIKLIEQ